MNLKNLTSSIMVAVMLIAAFALVVNVVVLKQVISQDFQAGQVTVDTVRGGANTYVYQEASSTASLVSDFKNRAALECWNTGATIVRMYLVATSTGITATSGVYMVANGGNFVPEFLWPGQIWTITDASAASTATSSVVCQETTR